jgi:hypothetical protein
MKITRRNFMQGLGALAAGLGLGLPALGSSGAVDDELSAGVVKAAAKAPVQFGYVKSVYGSWSEGSGIKDFKFYLGELRDWFYSGDGNNRPGPWLPLVGRSASPWFRFYVDAMNLARYPDVLELGSRYCWFIEFPDGSRFEFDAFLSSWCWDDVADPYRRLAGVLLWSDGNPAGMRFVDA